MSYIERKQRETFSHEQTTASDEWVINHFLNRRPIVNVYSVQNGIERIVNPSEVVIIDMDTCKLFFPSAISGIAEIT
jgi:hypothetical protein